MPEIERVSRRSDDFRFIAADAFGLGVTDKGVKLILGIEDVDNSILEQLCIVMNLSSFKMLSFLLDLAVTSHETKTGQKIPLDEKREEELRAIFLAAAPAPS